MAVHPGEVLTDVVRSLPGGLQKAYRLLLQTILLTPQQGERRGGQAKQAGRQRASASSWWRGSTCFPSCLHAASSPPGRPALPHLPALRSLQALAAACTVLPAPTWTSPSLLGAITLTQTAHPSLPASGCALPIALAWCVRQLASCFGLSKGTDTFAGCFKPVELPPLTDVRRQAQDAQLAAWLWQWSASAVGLQPADDLAPC